MIRVVFDRVMPGNVFHTETFLGYSWDTTDEGWTDISAKNGDMLVSLAPGTVLFIQDLDPESTSEG